MQFFRNLYRLLKVKIHVHHSHVTGKIEGHVHDFCNWTVRENKKEISVNYMNINGGEVKFIDTLKYYQTTLARLTKTATEQKNAVKKLTEEFLTSHDLFSRVWKFLGPHQKEKVLDIVSGGKGIIPYDMIVDINSLDIRPEGEFYETSIF